MKKGLFAEATEEERLIEMKELISCLSIQTVFKAEHVTIPVPIRGSIPKDKPEMFSLLDRLIEMARAGELDGFRERVTGL